MIKLVRILIIMFHNEKMIRLWNKFFIIDYFFSSGIFCLHCSQLWLERCGPTVPNSIVQREILTAGSDVTVFFNMKKISDCLTMYFMANSNIIVTYAMVSNCYFSLISKLQYNYLKYHILNHMKMIQIRSTLVERVVY